MSRPDKLPPLPHSTDPWVDIHEEETKTSCPACAASGVIQCLRCKGAGNTDLEPVAPRQYRWIRCTACDGRGHYGVCTYCHGAKMITATSASGVRRKLNL